MPQEPKDDGNNAFGAGPEVGGTQGPADNVEPCPPLTLEQQLAAKEEEIGQIQDRMLRLAAEMENTRKRLEREKADGISFANEAMLRELLPVVDNLERAVSHGADENSPSTLLEGVRMTLKGFLDALAKFGCSPFESVGQPFDPNLHEAVAQLEAPGQPPGVVIQELHKGYKLHERLLRPAMVIVSKALGSESQ